jgi:hypothetical protein
LAAEVPLVVLVPTRVDGASFLHNLNKYYLINTVDNRMKNPYYMQARSEDIYSSRGDSPHFRASF